MNISDYLTYCKKGEELEKKAIKLLKDNKIGSTGITNIWKALKRKKEKIELLIKEYEDILEKCNNPEYKKEYNKMVKGHLKARGLY